MSVFRGPAAIIAVIALTAVPAFADDIIGLLIGPLFILVELLFGLGLMRELHDAIETRAAR